MTDTDRLSVSRAALAAAMELPEDYVVVDLLWRRLAGAPDPDPRVPDEWLAPELPPPDPRLLDDNGVGPGRVLVLLAAALLGAVAGALLMAALGAIR